ncbi:MAG: threonine synthase [Flavobacteriaceae bacterium]|nr:threonine synthase [Flavobacteriaceae bacterium]MDZ4147176.1 threonine synthase [Flavobacteriaceae bacterium]
MKYYSLHHQSPEVSFETAVVNGLAPDKGLYFPENIQPLSVDFIRQLKSHSQAEIAYDVIKQFLGGEIPEAILKQIAAETVDFDFPLVKVADSVYSLELYHGPTMAFKDVGARFMARCLGYFNREKKDQKVTVLVATSGDTGGAVANGFLGVEGVEVIILYPSGKVSEIQEKQLTTLGQNITALEVAGTFDDCQDMVKRAFMDETLKSLTLTSANSINVARWLPQMFYYFFAVRQLEDLSKPIVFSVPSGNFGNICAGIVASKLGLPIAHFVASTNVNDIVPNYLISGEYEPKASKPTISNAMDVGNPSNFIRIQQLFDNNFDQLKKHFSAYSFTDAQTREAMKTLHKNHNYISDPHGAVGYLGLKKYTQSQADTTGIFLETAHPVKFLDEVEKTLNLRIPIPAQIAAVMDKTKTSIRISNYADLKRVLLGKD